MLIVMHPSATDAQIDAVNRAIEAINLQPVPIPGSQRTAYPDPTAFDKKHDHYDEGSDREKPRWVVVDVQLKRRLKHVITLEELRAHEHRELDGMLLLKRGNRLSITPLSAAHWKFILSME
jgi:predicted RNA-binding protein with PUA-like domain